jgi:hypothetical protein
MRSTAVSVGTTAVLLIAADDTHRTVYLHHESNHAIYLGGSNVSTGNGLHMKKSENLSIVLPSRQTIYAVSDTADQEIRVLTPDVD